jgi:Cft2 family RNA processing exonuclease
MAETERMEITPLGAGCEVGRSCCLVRFRGSTVMFDIGLHPAHSGLAALPFLDEVDLASVDLLLVTHFHMDHCGALAYLTEKTNFRGRIFMTHPTKAIFKILQHDAVKVGHDDARLFDEKDLLAAMDKIELINYHQTLEHRGVKFTCYNAGHVLGAAMFQIEVAGVRVLYTGDFSREEDRHLLGAEIPHEPPHVLIVESTYGVSLHEPQAVREQRFTSAIHQIVARGGRCLIPVFALGRSQEILLILDEYWKVPTARPTERAAPSSPFASPCAASAALYTAPCRPVCPLHRPVLLPHPTHIAWSGAPGAARRADLLRVQGGQKVDARVPDVHPLDEPPHPVPSHPSHPIPSAAPCHVRCRYINMMNEHVRSAHAAGTNPWEFTHVQNLDFGRGGTTALSSGFDDSRPMVVMASPGMMQSGFSRELFEMWCSDRRNGLMMPGYSVAGPLARHVEPSHPNPNPSPITHHPSPSPITHHHHPSPISHHPDLLTPGCSVSQARSPTTSCPSQRRSPPPPATACPSTSPSTTSPSPRTRTMRRPPSLSRPSRLRTWCSCTARRT